MKKLGAILATLAVVLPTSALADKLQVATSSTGLLYGTTYIAQQMGYFKEAGVDVSIFDGGGGSNAVASVVAGSADIGVVGIRNMAKALEQGVQLRAIGTGLDGLDLTLVVRSDLADGKAEGPKADLSGLLTPLKGKVIAVLDIGGSSGGFVRYLFKQAGLPSDFATLVNVNSNAGHLASLKGKRIDGFVNTSPVWQAAVAEGYGKALVVPSRDIPEVAGMHYIVQAVRQDTLQKRPEAIEKYLTGVYRAQLLIRRDPKAARDAFFGYLAKLTTSEPISESLRDVMWKSTDGLFPPSLELTPAGVTKARKFFAIPAAVSDESLVDNTFAKKVMGAVR